jgi:hypothetical protein
MLVNEVVALRLEVAAKRMSSWQATYRLDRVMARALISLTPAQRKKVGAFVTGGLLAIVARRLLSKVALVAYAAGATVSAVVWSRFHYANPTALANKHGATSSEAGTNATAAAVTPPPLGTTAVPRPSPVRSSTGGSPAPSESAPETVCYTEFGEDATRRRISDPPIDNQADTACRFLKAGLASSQRDFTDVVVEPPQLDLSGHVAAAFPFCVQKGHLVFGTAVWGSKLAYGSDSCKVLRYIGRDDYKEEPLSMLLICSESFDLNERAVEAYNDLVGVVAFCLTPANGWKKNVVSAPTLTADRRLVLDGKTRIATYFELDEPDHLVAEVQISPDDDKAPRRALVEIAIPLNHRGQELDAGRR